MLELAVFTCILSVLFVVSTPTLSKTLTKGAFVREVSNMRYLLAKASLQAGLRSVRILATFDKTRVRLATTSVSILERVYKEKVKLVGNQSVQVTFFSGISATPRTISLSDGTHSCNLLVSLRGRIRQSC